jgi:tRNA uridine 5-carboxymethylaminomethyl modification enzyme
METKYDVIVVGAGHAGCEAAAAAATIGVKVLMITMDMGRMGQMSCNPAMGGIAKGQIVREIDALGGYSGIISDESMIQFRMLNRSKGPAMWSPRTQNDRALFNERWRWHLEQIPNLDFWQDMVKEVVVEGNQVTGVTTQMGIKFNSKTVIVTSGTFLNGIIHIGEKQFGGGRAGEKAASGLTEQLNAFGFRSGRMKTGTPPRLDGRSLDYSKMEIQEGDPEISGFSFLPTKKPMQQRACHITYTNTQVHDTLRTGFEKSPMFNGRIQGLGPRYCPSIEDKIDRFADKDRHQLFVEPEGWNTVEVYVNGFSSSLPEEVQFKALRQIKGFEQAKMFRPGYAIEYDFFPPEQLKHSLETKGLENLYFAGQINGTTGYEEAACQGLMAGINAARKTQNKEAIVLNRDQAYIGVLIDDLITKSTDEPYRMFTSRAEYRILLRQDNADERLTPVGSTIGLVSDERLERFETKKDGVDKAVKLIKTVSAEPEKVNPILQENQTNSIPHKVKWEGIIARPQISINTILPAFPELKELQYSLTNINTEVLEQAEIKIKYQGYMDREKENAEKLNRLTYVKLPDTIDYMTIPSLSMEARTKLTKHRPETLGEASRISGISPSDISVLLILLGR